MIEIPTVLLVEDDPACQDLYRIALANQNINVHLVSEGSQALELLATGLPCSVLVADFELPDMDGCQLIRAASPLSPVSTKIMVSSKKEHEMELAPETQWRVSEFLNKPINVKQFVETITAGIEKYYNNLNVLLKPQGHTD